MTRVTEHLAALRGWLSALHGWRRHAVTAAIGGLATLAMPPVHALPLLWLSLPALMLMIEDAPRPRAALASGWWWGLGHFSLGFYWIANALLIEPWKFGWFIPVAVCGLGGVVACFVAGAAWAARRFATPGLPRLLIMAAAWVFLEWARSWVLTGFPWNLLGSVWIAILPVAQAASVIGTYGLSLITLLAALSPALLLIKADRHPARLITLAHMPLVLAALWGISRIPATPQETWSGVTLRLVQGNVNQAEKWLPGMRWLHLQQHLELSQQPGFEHLSAVIWPETAAPGFLEQDQRSRTMVAAAAPPGGLLITGTPRGTFDDHDTLTSLWNSVQAITPMGDIVATYDKAHLVPFGEYVPYKSFLPMPKITAGNVDFSAGPGPVSLTLPNLPPVSPIICYEAIFPQAVADHDHRPAWLLNLSNYGWFGNSAGPYQHYASARLRAIEEGLPLVSAANTGITSVVDPFGRSLGELPLGVKGYLDLPLPKPLVSATFYDQYGNMMVFLPLFVIVVMAVGFSRLSRLRLSR